VLRRATASTASLTLIAALVGCASAFAQMPPGTRVLRDIEYARIDDRPLRLDLYLPPDTRPNPPLLIWVHGGGWRGGSKDRCMLQWLSDEFAVASIEYRLSQVAPFPAQVHDCKGAIRWLRAHASRHGYDARRIGAAGGSAGEHLVALLGTSAGVEPLEGAVGGHLDQTSAVQAVVNLFGPMDLTLYDKPETRAAARLNPIDHLLGGKLHEKLELAKLASPVTHVNAGDAPLMTLHGDRDKLVPVAHGRHIHDIYRQAGLPSTLHVLAGAGHGGRAFAAPTMQERIRAFFRDNIRRAAPKAE